MKLIKLIIIFLFMELSSCSYLKNVQLLTAGKLKRKEFVQELPFEYKKGLIVVKVRVNNDLTYREFIFDTGAFNSKIEYELANQLGLETVTSKKNSTAQGNTQTIEVTQIDSIRLGETTFYSIGAGKLKYSEGSASPCIAPHGLIGANLIKLAHWKINYAAQKIYFSDTPFRPSNSAIQIDFSRPIFSATPKVNINLEERKVEGLLFDTGFNGGLVLPYSLKSQFASEVTRTFIDQSTTGIYGTNIDTLEEKQLNLKMGKLQSEIPVEFSSLGKGLLGNEYLEHFTVLIDNDKNQIWLEPNKEIKMDEAYSFIPGVLNDSLWVVDKVELTKMHELQLGDTLQSVNGFQPNDLFDTHCDYVMNIRSLLTRDTIRVITNQNESFTIY